MKTRLLILQLFFCCSVSFSQVTNTCTISNAGFENGNTTGWILKSGGYGVAPCGSGTCPRHGTTYTGGAVAGALNSPVGGAGNRHTLMSTAGGNDPNSVAGNLVPVVAPGGGNYSFRLGNANVGNGGPGLSEAEAIRLTIPVTSQNASFTYRYAFFVEDGSHAFEEQPSFEVVVLDQNNVLIPCGRYFVVAGNYPSCVSGTGFITGNNGYVYKPWTDVGLDLTGYIGQNVSIEFRTTDCLPSGTGSSTTSCSGNTCTLTNSNGTCTYTSGSPACVPTGGTGCKGSPGTHSAYAYIDAYCAPLNVIAPVFCAGASSIQICAPIGYNSYSWPAGQSGISGAPTTRCVTVNNPIEGTTYTVNMVSATGCPTSTKVTLKGFDLTLRDTTLCNGSTPFPLTLTPSYPGNYNYSWSPSTGLSCTTCQNPTYTPGASSTSYTVTMTDPVLGCSRTKVINITLKSTSSVTAIGTTVCSGVSGTLTATGQSCSGAVTYSWSPSTFLSGTTGTTVTATNPTTTTTYTVTATNGSGQTATATALLTVKPNPVISVPPATICSGTCTPLTASGATTYTWSPATGLSSVSGTTVTACPTTSTTYTVVGTTNGCTGLTSVVVTVNPNPIISVPPATICPGASAPLTASGATTYTWSPAAGINSTTGVTVTTTATVTTTYTVVGTSLGCTGSTTVMVTVTPPCGPGVSTMGATVCEGVCGTVTSTAFGGTAPYTYLWNTGATTSSLTPSPCPTLTTTYTVTVADNSVPAGTASAIAVITVNPNPIVAVTPATICEGASATLTASGATTYTWIPLTDLSSGTGTSVTANPKFTTTYTVTGSNPTGCTGTTEVEVTVNPIPVVAVASASICPGGSTPLTATGATTYTWTPATDLSSGTGTTVTASPAVTSTYTVVGTGPGGCTASTTVVVSVGALVASVSPNITICFGASTQLTAGGGSVYSWTPATTLDNPNIASPIASPTVTTTYTVVVSGATCSDKAVVVVTVDPPIILNVAPVNVTCFGACNGQTIVIPSGGASPYKYAWSSGCTTAACSKLCPGTYTLTVTDVFGCTATGTTTVTEPPAFTISAVGGNACPGDSIGLSVTGAVSYSWSPSIALTATTGDKVTARPKSTTTYSITGTNASGCTATTSVVAKINPKPNASFTTSPDMVSTFNPTIYFIDQSSGGVINSWKWTFGDPKNTTSILQNPSLTYPDTANKYQVQLIVTNQFGCIDTVIGTVVIHGIFTFYIPNTFTPNNDGTNDRFLPRGVGIDETDYDLWIFDRWGNLIWHTEIWGDSWDGKANKGADIAQIDTYVWKVHVKEKETGAKHNYIGHVNIVK